MRRAAGPSRPAPPLASNIRKGTPGTGKTVNAAAKKACGTASQAYKATAKEVDAMKDALKNHGYDPESLDERGNISGSDESTYQNGFRYSLTATLGY